MLATTACLDRLQAYWQPLGLNMSLPFILEIAIGLLFVYLILSLLASEVQEIIGTVLQWRAEHLKRSIEVLLAGNDANSKTAAQNLADRLYESPLIRSLNQESSGPIGKIFRWINHNLGRLYRGLTRTRNTFGQGTSGPSSIPANAFAQTLLENLHLDEIRQRLVQGRLRRFVDERLMLPVNHIVNDLRASTANEFLLNAEFRQLEQTVAQVVQDFQEGRANLLETLERLLERLDEFAVMAQEVLPDDHHLTETFMRRLRYLKRSLANSDLDKATLVKKLRPSLQELLTVLDQGSALYREFEALVKKDGKASESLLKQLPQTIPPSLRNSLHSLAEEAKHRASNLEDDIREFTREIETWFSRGMDRASGVYRRNARAVALLIGIAIAVSLNADSIHIVERLSSDPTIRDSISRAAEQFANNNPEILASDPAEVKKTVDSALETVPIPIGYRASILEQQAAAETRWLFPVPRRMLGWLITGVAISMGSKFWFDLLKKVINVKTSGRESR